MLKTIDFDKDAEGAFYIRVLAENLKNICEHFHLTQEELSGMTSVSVNEISKIEREIVNPGLITIAALARGLGLDIDTLLTPNLDVSKLDPP